MFIRGWGNRGAYPSAGLQTLGSILGGIGSGISAYDAAQRRREELARQKEEFDLRKRVAESSLKLHDLQMRNMEEEAEQRRKPLWTRPGIPATPGMEGYWRGPEAPNLPTEPVDMQQTDYRWEAPEPSAKGPGIRRPSIWNPVTDKMGEMTAHFQRGLTPEEIATIEATVEAKYPESNVPERDISLGSLVPTQTRTFPESPVGEPVGADPGTYIPGTPGTPAIPPSQSRYTVGEIKAYGGLRNLLPFLGSEELSGMGMEALSKPEKPISVGGKGVYTRGKGFEEAPWATAAPDKWIKWGHGQMKNTATGDTVDVPTKPGSERPISRRMVQGEKQVEMQWNPVTMAWEPIPGMEGPRKIETPEKPLTLKDHALEDSRLRGEARHLAIAMAAKEGYGKVVMKPDGSFDMNWLTPDAPEKFMREVQRQYERLVGQSQERGLLPKDWLKTGAIPVETQEPPTVSSARIPFTLGQKKEYDMASEAIAKYPEKAGVIKEEFKKRTGLEWR